jgi:hypothetical protein
MREFRGLEGCTLTNFKMLSFTAVMEWLSPTLMIACCGSLIVADGCDAWGGRYPAMCKRRAGLHRVYSRAIAAVLLLDRSDTCRRQAHLFGFSTFYWSIGYHLRTKTHISLSMRAREVRQKLCFAHPALLSSRMYGFLWGHPSFSKSPSTRKTYREHSQQIRHASAREWRKHVSGLF